MTVVVMVCILVAIIVSTVAIAAKQRGDRLTILAVLGAYYLLAYGVGSVYLLVVPDMDPRSLVGPDDLAASLTLAVVSWSALAAGFLLNPLRSLARRIPDLPQVRPDLSITVRLSIAYAIGWAARAVELANGDYFHVSLEAQVVSDPFHWLITVIATIPTLVTALVGATAYLATDGNRDRSGRMRFYLLAVIEVVWYVPSGARAPIVGIMLLLLVVSFYGRGRVPWRTLLVGTLASVFILFPFVLALRGNDASYTQHVTFSLQDTWTAMAAETPDQIVQSGLSATLSRFADARVSAIVMRYGDSRYPLAQGATLSWILTDLIPRFILPNKPDPGLFGNEFGRDFGLISGSDYTTSISIGPAAELYLNFGWFGVVLGMLLVGVVYRLIDELLASRQRNAGTLALYAVSAWPLAQGLGVIIASGLIGALKALALEAAAVAAITAPRQRSLASKSAPMLPEGPRAARVGDRP